MQYYSTLKAKLVYIFTINDAAHAGCVKIGDATLDEATDSTLSPNCKEYIRIIDGSEFIDMWNEYYDKMSDEDKNRLPLKRIAFLGSNE